MTGHPPNARPADHCPRGRVTSAEDMDATTRVLTGMSTDSPDSPPASNLHQLWSAMPFPYSPPVDAGKNETPNDSLLDRVESSLDPKNWEAFQELAAVELAQLVDHLSQSRERPAWQPLPVEVKAALQAPLPWEAEPAAQVCQEIRSNILPWCLGNTHPRFFGWVHGTGTAGGMLAEMFAGAINANLGGREHAPVYVERAVIEWCRQLFQFPSSASGLLLSGTSMATMLALTIARNHLAPIDLRQHGMAGLQQRMIVYVSAEAHCSVIKAAEFIGLGRKSVRLIDVDRGHQLNWRQLQMAIQNDRQSGNLPFCVVGTAGTVNCGAIDDLHALASICDEEQLWFHIDGAFGALAVLSDEHRFLLRGIERADSLAFDFHKWMHVPYDAGCLLVRDEEIHRRSFAVETSYLTPGSAAADGNPWYCDFGPELSRGFRALKVWFTMKEHGLKRLGQKIAENCQQARFLRECILSHPDFELLAPAPLNIVCFRYGLPGCSEKQLERLNAEVVNAIQTSGTAVVSTTRIHGKLAIRVNITNHRTTIHDLTTLIESIQQEATRLLDNQAVDFAGAESMNRPGEPDSPDGLRMASILERAELQPLLRRFTVHAQPGLELPIRFQKDHDIQIQAELLETECEGAVLVRHALEILVLRAVSQVDSPVGQVTQVLIGLDTAMKYRHFHFPSAPPAHRCSIYSTISALEIDQNLAGATVEQLERVAEMLLPCHGYDRRVIQQLRRQDWTMIQERLKTSQPVLGPAELLVTTGGDTRLRMDAANGLSRYGCHRTPQPRWVSYGSSTATSLTPNSLAECERVRQQLVAASLHGRLQLEADALAGYLKQEIRNYCGAADLEGMEVVLCSSGTDAELIATCLKARSSALPLTNILVAPSESGSGLPLAANGCHYDSLTPSGNLVNRGESLMPETGVPITTVHVPARDGGGELRSASEIHRQIKQAVAAAVIRGNCLLHVLATSKTGWQFPGHEFVDHLKRQFGERLTIVVDACQLRQHRSSLREHLQSGHLLQLTGSKTFGGPPFSGALLIPAEFAEEVSDIRDGLEGLCDYSSRSEWPPAWQATKHVLDRGCNPGLILRWAAAVREMQRFDAIPDQLKADVLIALAGTVGTCLFRSHVVSPLTDCCSDLPPASSDAPWEAVQTIFPFRLRHPGRRGEEGWLTHHEMQQVHRLLNQDLSSLTSDPGRCPLDDPASQRFQVGQPVLLAECGPRSISVLRVCLGAHVVSRVVFDGSPQSISQRMRQEQQQIEQVFGKIHFILENWAHWQSHDTSRAIGQSATVEASPVQPIQVKP